ncbi:GntR family transcriptional regulator [Falsarthrobacter nasiphocae]|uniref:DNA-binding transcriptional regulator YhcF (GntR family) n=1 Tax=Falsarthrobacter nasiphocae TaxID=189863 RepID=A0AAE3YFF9_9MICC|nr:GntR family transcriptional regulator [Falsarthrobacter nasiphocae]MDR6891169.1 DNA-binding transcriptional regulator YhcF (GntR family) [Falsarthrobacter nasiphocae]
MKSPIPSWLSTSSLQEYAGPPVVQITSAVVDAINRADAASGDRLPPVRKLAEHLGVAVNTVAKAYKRLEDWELVEGRGRGGTVVSTDAFRLRDDVRRMAASLVRAANRAGIRVEELHSMVDAAHERQRDVASSTANGLESNTRSPKMRE